MKSRHIYMVCFFFLFLRSPLPKKLNLFEMKEGILQKHLLVCPENMILRIASSIKHFM